MVKTSTKPKQKEFPAIPKTELGKACEEWLKVYEDINEFKEVLEGKGQRILEILKKENRTSIALNYNGEFHKFEVDEIKKKRLKHSKPVAKFKNQVEG